MGPFELFAALSSRRTVRKLTGGCAFSASLFAGAAMSSTLDVTLDRLLDICAAATVEAASLKGDMLGWSRLSDAQVDDWRRHFLIYNGGTVDVVGWRRDPDSDEEAVSFWIADGPNSHKACTYSTASGNGLLEALSERLGKPDTLDKNDVADSVSSFWQRNSVDYSFTQIGARSLLSIGRQN